MKKAIDWYTKSAEKGEAKAQFSLGNLYYQGAAVPKNNEESTKWYLLAAH